MTTPPEMRVLEAEIGTLTLEVGDVLAVIKPVLGDGPEYALAKREK